MIVNWFSINRRQNRVAMTIFNHHHPDTGGHQRSQPRCPAPDFLPAFPNAERVRPESGRIRWRDTDGTVLEWDSHRAALDVYGHDGWHLGEYDHVRGSILGVAEPGRRIEP
jgi:hypothetical protein